ncbi:MAG: DUF4160 domain-containing protein [Pseudomonadales bacterium]|nr:DUF4160 domain-containing protein [Pseudomonadales bacterium]
MHQNETMPTLARLARSTITMYADDHLPPHFHVRMNDGREALIVIADLQILRGNIARRELAEVVMWAQTNRSILTKKWKELNP